MSCVGATSAILVSRMNELNHNPRQATKTTVYFLCRKKNTTLFDSPELWGFFFLFFDGELDTEHMMNLKLSSLQFIFLKILLHQFIIILSLWSLYKKSSEIRLEIIPPGSCDAWILGKKINLIGKQKNR